MTDVGSPVFSYTGAFTRQDVVRFNLLLYWRNFRFTSWRWPVVLLVAPTVGSLLVGAYLHAVGLCLVPLLVLLIILAYCHVMIIVVTYALMLLNRLAAAASTVSLGAVLRLEAAHYKLELEWPAVKEVLVTRRCLMIVLTNGSPLCMLPTRVFAEPDERLRLLAFLGSVGVRWRRVLGPGL